MVVMGTFRVQIWSQTSCNKQHVVKEEKPYHPHQKYFLQWKERLLQNKNLGYDK